MEHPQITDPLFRKALSLPPDDAVEQKVAQTIELLQSYFPTKSLKVPEIVYDLKGTTAGQAVFNKNLTVLRIRINNDILYTDDKDAMLSQTVPHEVCHIVQKQLWPYSKSHGHEWQYLMLLLGLPPTRCHSYEVSKARNKSKLPRPYIYHCRCYYNNGREFKLTQIKHRRIQEGTNYCCPHCRGVISYVRTDFLP